MGHALINADLILQIHMAGTRGGDTAMREMRVEAVAHVLDGIPEDWVCLRVGWGG
jgi:hypothetical protein